MHKRSSILVLFAIGCARHTPPSTDVLPAPLVSALLQERGSPTGPARTFAVGSLPAGFPTALVPTGPVTILGGMVTSDEVIAIFSDSTRRLAAVFEDTFERAGFKRPPPTPGRGFSGGSGPYTFFCGDSATVSAEPLTGSGRNATRVTYRRTTWRGGCPTEEVERPEPKRIRIPELTAPNGAFVQSAGSGSGNSEVRSNAIVTGTSLAAPAIVAHYTAQLLAAGWTAGAPASGDRIAAQFLQAKDESGGAWEGYILAVSVGSTINLSLSMRPARR